MSIDATHGVRAAAALLTYDPLTLHTSAATLQPDRITLGRVEQDFIFAHCFDSFKSTSRSLAGRTLSYIQAKENRPGCYTGAASSRLGY